MLGFTVVAGDDVRSGGYDFVCPMPGRTRYGSDRCPYCPGRRFRSRQNVVEHVAASHRDLVLELVNRHLEQTGAGDPPVSNEPNGVDRALALAPHPPAA